MKRFIYTVSIILTIIILSLGAEETKNVPESGKHFGQIESIYCNTAVAPEGQATIPVQFQAMASKGHRAGDLVAVDNIVGIMRFVPATGPEGFLQGSPTSEPGRKADETQFTHILTRNIAMMETEVTIGMWTALQSVQPHHWQRCHIGYTYLLRFLGKRLPAAHRRGMGVLRPRRNHNPFLY
jgi:hypothetical protein